MNEVDKNGRVHIEDDDARAASSPGILRYILAISLILAIVAMSIAWMTGALTQGSVESAATASGTAEAAEEDVDQTDGVVGDESLSE